VDKRLFWLGLPLLALVTWYVWSNQGTHSVSLDERATDPSYSPFAHWMIQRPGGYVHVFPDRVGPACLNSPLQNEDDGALSTSVTAYEVEAYASA
jgi:hypothetical protein